MKKILYVITISFLIVIFLNFISVEASDNEIYGSSTNDISEEAVVQEIEEYLADNNTSVVNELNKVIIEYENQSLNTTSEIKRDKLNTLISRVNLCIDNFNLYYEYMNCSLDERILLPPIPSTSDVVISSAIAYFKFNNYDLSAELLIHSMNNEQLDSIYEPINQNIR